VSLLIRFKFESDPASSIKLAASYEFPKKNDLQHHNRIKENNVTLKGMLNVLTNQIHVEKSNTSNAIGKCNEALIYAEFLKRFPTVKQVDTRECITFLEKYSRIVKRRTLNQIYESSVVSVSEVIKTLTIKHKEFNLEEIQLVPESYLEDRLNSADLKLILNVNGKLVEELLSLKAIANKNAKITTKNPGMGSILGPNYFGITDMAPIVALIKSKYENGEIDHINSLRYLSTEIGKRLEQATQSQLQRGIQNLLGSAIMVVTIYNKNQCVCIEHERIETSVYVAPRTPTPIQTTLTWNNLKETLYLRVKFSKGQHHGWSSVKLASEYQIK
jgi:hypothetical protein